MSRTPSDLLTPAAALALWAELRTDPPRNPRSLHARAATLGVEPYTVNRVIQDPNDPLDYDLYSGDLAGARRWLEEAAAEREGGGA